MLMTTIYNYKILNLLLSMLNKNLPNKLNLLLSMLNKNLPNNKLHEKK